MRQIRSVSQVSIRLRLMTLTAGFGLLSGAPSGWAALTEGSPCPSGGLSPQALVAVTAEARPGKTYRLNALVDSQGDLQHLQYEGSRLGTVCFSVNELKRGVLIMKQESREVLRLSVRSDFDSKDGGTARLEFLSNGVTGNYGQFPTTLDRSGSWRLFSGGQAFNHLHFRNRTGVFGVVIGVQRPEASLR
jgi:hypothetical protein